MMKKKQRPSGVRARNLLVWIEERGGATRKEIKEWTPEKKWGYTSSTILPTLVTRGFLVQDEDGYHIPDPQGPGNVVRDYFSTSQKRLTSEEQKFFDYLNRQGCVPSAPCLSKALSISPARVSSKLLQLTMKGYLTREGHGKYKIGPPPPVEVPLTERQELAVAAFAMMDEAAVEDLPGLESFLYALVAAVRDLQAAEGEQTAFYQARYEQCRDLMTKGEQA